VICTKKINDKCTGDILNNDFYTKREKGFGGYYYGIVPKNKKTVRGRVRNELI